MEKKINLTGVGVSIALALLFLIICGWSETIVMGMMNQKSDFDFWLGVILQLMLIIGSLALVAPICKLCTKITVKKEAGFTLIEMLIVIAIIAT